MRSRLVDRGPETMVLFPAVAVTDSRGNEMLRPDMNKPIRRRVTVSGDRQSDAELPGQVSVKIIKVVCRSVPDNSWALVHFRNEEWDVAKPVTMSAGVTKATRHCELILRSRNMTLQASNGGP